MTSHGTLEAAADRLAALLLERKRKIVFAESCTAGLASAALARIPGISACHCGSAVVYRIETKAEWLGIPRDLLDNSGPVSAAVAVEMAAGVLARTPEADCAASVTGHLGPGAPEGEDGLVYIATAVRAAHAEARPATTVHEHRLASDLPGQPRSDEPLRVRRQGAAAALVLQTAADALDGDDVPQLAPPAHDR